MGLLWRIPWNTCCNLVKHNLAKGSCKPIFSNHSYQVNLPNWILPGRKCDPQPAVTQSGSGVTWDITSCCIISHGMTSSASDPLGPAHHLHQNCTVRGSLNSPFNVLLSAAELTLFLFLLTYMFIGFCRHEVWLHRNGSLGSRIYSCISDHIAVQSFSSYNAGNLTQWAMDTVVTSLGLACGLLQNLPWAWLL